MYIYLETEPLAVNGNVLLISLDNVVCVILHKTAYTWLVHLFVCMRFLYTLL